MALSGLYECTQEGGWDFVFVLDGEEFYVVDEREDLEHRIKKAKKDLVRLGSSPLEEPVESFCLPLEFFDF